MILWDETEQGLTMWKCHRGIVVVTSSYQDWTLVEKKERHVDPCQQPTGRSGRVHEPSEDARVMGSGSIALHYMGTARINNSVLCIISA